MSTINSTIAALIESLHGRVMMLARKYAYQSGADKDDLYQIAMLAMLEGATRHLHEVPTEKQAHYLTVCASNAIKWSFRSRVSVVASASLDACFDDDERTITLGDLLAAPDCVLSNGELPCSEYAALYDALGELGEKHQAVLMHHYGLAGARGEGTVKDLAQEWGLSRGTVASRLNYAEAKLRIALNRASGGAA